MKLSFKAQGDGRPLVILHGLFGSGDNWQTMANRFAADFKVYLVDQRNHGHSAHTPDHSYRLMADDLLEFFEEHEIKDAVLLGHSMGGKTAMLFASENSYLLDKLVVADIAPKQYPPHHQHILAALNSVDFQTMNTRKLVEAQLRTILTDDDTIFFMLKNLYWKTPGQLDWRFNVSVLSKTIADITDDGGQQICLVDTLFVRGLNSNYITDEDQIYLDHYFPHNQLSSIDGAGHWLHAEAPDKFFEIVHGFLIGA
ncbi:MAG: alpha/beta fold hydrolase [Cryomorphaceae bacterium]|nr:alpha/beta fold hydrolase [Cryomorphaceae bacterium]